MTHTLCILREREGSKVLVCFTGKRKRRDRKAFLGLWCVSVLKECKQAVVGISRRRKKKAGTAESVDSTY